MDTLVCRQLLPFWTAWIAPVYIVGGVGRKCPVAIYEIRAQHLTHPNHQADRPTGTLGA